MPKILIVDDDPMAAKSLSVLLSVSGYVVEYFLDGEKAIENSAEFKPDFLVVDQHLGDGLDGLTVAASIRRQLPGIFSVVITGNLSEDLTNKIDPLSSTEYLSKPFQLHELLGLFRSREASGTN